MIAFAAHLKDAREKAGLSIDDIHEKTRISKKNLLLIESGAFPSLPQTYVRAFIREYARIVGLDEDGTVLQYNETAEREKGIPKPPKSIDSSNLLPKIDDTIELIPASDASQSHVEVSGHAEVQPEEFTPHIRRSRFVDETHAAPIDIRTTKKDAESFGEHPTGHGRPKDSPISEHESAPTSVDAPETFAPPVPELPFEEADQDEAQVTEIKESQLAAPPPEIVSQTDQDSPPPEERKKRGKRASRERPSVYDTKPPIEETRAAKEKPRKEPSEESRIIGIGSIIILILAVSVYAIFFFGRSDDDAEGADSSGYLTDIDANQFIDSTQFINEQPEPTPQDTMPATEPAQARASQQSTNVFASEDSLVLEAFSNAPVWFSLKMDTTRTERGSLLTNEHRTWKARNYFLVTLGDAGAVTFFLNGREIGTLGEEGAVVKNVMLSRQNF